MDSISNIGISPITQTYSLSNIGENQTYVSSVDNENSLTLKDLNNTSINNEGVLSLNYTLNELRNYSERVYSDFSDLNALFTQYNTITPAVTSSGDSVTYTENGILQDGEYVIDVNQLAQGEIITSTNVSDPSSALGQWGSFLIDGAQVDVTTTDTLYDIADKINSVTSQTYASVINNQLVLKDQSTGALATIDLKDMANGNGFFSNDPSVATTNTLLDNSAWSHDISVNQLAQSQITSSDAQSSATNSLGISGQFSINGTQFSVTDDMSLNDIENMVNGASIGITASIDSNNKLIFTSDQTGTVNAFTLTDDTTESDNFTSSDTTNVQTNTLISNTDWTHDVNVTQLADNQEVHGNTYADVTSALGLNGSFTLDGKLINVSESDSLTSIMNNINASGSSVTASISGGRLYLTDPNTGAVNAFTALDNTDNWNSFTSSDTTVATTGNLLDNSNWTHTVEVVQLYSATTNTDYQQQSFDDFSTNSSNWNFLTSGWSISGGTLNETKSNYQLNTKSALYSPSSSFQGDRVVSTDLLINSTSPTVAGAYLDYVDANNYTEAFIASGDNQLVLAKKVNGVLTKQAVSFNVSANTSYKLETGTDGSGNFWANIYNSSGSLLTTNSVSGWTDAKTTGGSAGLLTQEDKASFDNFSVKADYRTVITSETLAQYKVDGVLYTVNTNSNVDIAGDATINLNNIGSTIVQNQKTDGVLRDLGILNSSNTDFLNYDSYAQDAIYSVDGSVFSNATNNNIMLQDGVTGINEGTIDLISTGTSTVSNQHTDSILNDLGMLSGTSIKHLDQAAQDLSYSVDGTNYTSSTNSNITIYDSTGNADATIDVTGTGSTTIYNKTGNILENLGIIDASGNKLNIVQNAQDTKYTINGVSFFSNNNNVNTDFGLSLTFDKVGTTTISIEKGEDIAKEIQRDVGKEYNLLIHFMNKKRPFLSDKLLSKFDSIIHKNHSNLLSAGIKFNQDSTIDTSKFKLNANNMKVLQSFVNDMKDLAGSIYQSPFGTFANEDYLQMLYTQSGTNYLSGKSNSGLINKKY